MGRCVGAGLQDAVWCAGRSELVNPAAKGVCAAEKRSWSPTTAAKWDLVEEVSKWDGRVV